MSEDVYIGEAARRLKREEEILRARHYLNGRVYDEFEIARLRAVGVRQRPKRLKRPGVLPGAAP